ncbi:MAG: hypothetical protein U0793_11140 [Gemmataceae bacterium]
MIVNLEDGRCRTCGGQLEIMDTDDCSMSVTCMDCADSYPVEPDAFGDGCMTYFFPIRTRQMLGKEDEA